MNPKQSVDNIMKKYLILALLAACLTISSCTTQPMVGTLTSTPTQTIDPDQITISMIQGEGHRSPMEGRKVNGVEGIVTAIRADGYYLQAIQPDGNVLTSDAIFVYTRMRPRIEVGNILAVHGIVDELYPGGVATGNLPITKIDQESYTLLEEFGALPEPVQIGQKGRVPPGRIIDNDKFLHFDPDEDGIDFYETLESMLVEIDDPLVVGPTNAYNEIVVLADGGLSSGLISRESTIVIQKNDFNPERIMLDDLLVPLPQVNSGDRFSGPVIGIMDYNYGNFKVLPIRKPQKVTGSISTFDVPERDPDEISIAVYNLENLDPSDPPSRFQTLGKHIVDILKSPDILGLVEIQDNTGPLDDQVVDASLTYKAIINAILENGGPVYEFRDIPPLNNRDGGETGGNIRVGFLFRTDRGVAFWDKPGGDAVNEVGLNRDDTGVSLTVNPGRIQPNAYAFFESRKPLVGEFVFRGQKIFVILNHFNSKGGDTALFGSIQPPVQNSEFQRKRQAQAVHDFATEILQLDPDARIIIMGDLNDFQFSETLTTLMGRDFTNLISILPPEQQYTYIYEGNAQVLDHMVVSRVFFESLSYFDVVHLNSIYHEDINLSDHDPLIAIFEMK